MEVQYLHDFGGITGGVSLAAQPLLNFSCVLGKSLLSIGADLSFDTATTKFAKCNAGFNFNTSILIASLTLYVIQSRSPCSVYIHTYVHIIKHKLNCSFIQFYLQEWQRWHFECFLLPLSESPDQHCDCSRAKPWLLQKRDYLHNWYSARTISPYIGESSSEHPRQGCCSHPAKVFVYLPFYSSRRVEYQGCKKYC